MQHSQAESYVPLKPQLPLAASSVQEPAPVQLCHGSLVLQLGLHGCRLLQLAFFFWSNDLMRMLLFGQSAGS
jgi:hypothetical protein